MNMTDRDHKLYAINECIAAAKGLVTSLENVTYVLSHLDTITRSPSLPDEAKVATIAAAGLAAALQEIKTGIVAGTAKVYVVTHESDGGTTLGCFESEALARACVRSYVETENLGEDRQKEHAPDGLLWRHRPKWVETQTGAAQIWTEDGGQEWSDPQEAHDTVTITPFEVQREGT